MKKETKKNHILQRPEYPGGRKALLHTITSNLRYPDNARKAGITGTVHLRYGINYKGEVVDVRVIKGIGYGCDEEAIRLVKLLKFTIKKTRGVKVLFHRTLQVHFHPSNMPPTPSIPQKPLDQTPPTIQYHYTDSPSSASTSTTGQSIHFQISLKEN